MQYKNHTESVYCFHPTKRGVSKRNEYHVGQRVGFVVHMSSGNVAAAVGLHVQIYSAVQDSYVICDQH